MLSTDADFSDAKVAWYAHVWRQADKEAIADKSDPEKQRAEYRARRQLRHAIDIAERRQHAQKGPQRAGKGRHGPAQVECLGERKGP